MAGFTSLSLKKAHMANTAGGRLIRIPAREMAASVDRAIGLVGRASGVRRGRAVDYEN